MRFHIRGLLTLGFRCSEDFRSRLREKSIMEDLLRNDIGGGYCHAWYARRFFSPAQVAESPSPHSGLGIKCYTQLTSPIRCVNSLACLLSSLHHSEHSRAKYLTYEHVCVDGSETFKCIPSSRGIYGERS